MSASIILWSESGDTREIKVPEQVVSRQGPIALVLFLCRPTKAELFNELIPGELGFCEEDRRLYFRSRPSGDLYSAQLEKKQSWLQVGWRWIARCSARAVGIDN